MTKRSTNSSSDVITVDGTSFALNGRNMSYRFHVDEASGDLISDHFGGRITEDILNGQVGIYGGWFEQSDVRREFPDTGRGDFRMPAVRIRHAEGHSISQFKYQSYSLFPGKPSLKGLPCTFSDDAGLVRTLVIHMRDKHSSLRVDLSYSIFPKNNSIARSATIYNDDTDDVVVEKLASFSVDLPHADYDMLGLRGEWSREFSKTRRRVDYGVQGFGSAAGYSSPFHSPFIGLSAVDATESQGDVWGYSLIYSGSFSANIEKAPNGLVRTTIGLNEHQLSWPLKPDEHLTSPECIGIYSSQGVGGMSRHLHNLFRQHLIRSPLSTQPRPILLNSWEGVYFNFDETKILQMAQESAKLGIQLFVMDDGWFGVKYPRVGANAGLGDWTPNPDRFPNGIGSMIDKITRLPVAASTSQQTLKFGIWVEPEMVNRKSELFETHPDWVLRTTSYALTEVRNQLVLNLALTSVQDYIIDSLSRILQDKVSYIKWDCNRAIHEVPSLKMYHAYMLGLYRVLDILTTRFPNVLWEGCAAGGGRYDAGLLPYFPQSWVSDNTDPVDRVAIQFGATLAFPPSTMGCHVAQSPNHTTGRSTSLTFRSHVAMMGGSFGFELDPVKLTTTEREQIPSLIKLAERINPIVIKGDLWRLSLPEQSQYPAAMYISVDQKQVVVFAFQMVATTVHCQPTLRLKGLDPDATYITESKSYSGLTLMNGGMRLGFKGDYDSCIVIFDRL